MALLSGQISPAANTLEVLITIPSDRNVHYPTVLVHNTDTADHTFSCAVALAGAVDAAAQYVQTNALIPAGATVPYVIPVSFQETDEIRVKTDADHLVNFLCQTPTSPAR